MLDQDTCPHTNAGYDDDDGWSCDDCGLYRSPADD